MRKFFLILIIANICSNLFAQKVDGEYYLHGVMEVGSGFLLKPDSTFEFFFSYGALDREGSGRWTMKEKQIILNSRTKHSPDFTLLSSKKTGSDFTTIKIVGDNPNLLMYIHGILKLPDTTIEEITNEQGEFKFSRKGFEHITLVFEFSPEKVTDLTINKEHDYFKFRMEPSITEVVFDNFHLQVGTNELRGKHPLLKEKEFIFEKSK
ncbi:MAG: hypothetical protein ABIO81_03495 [Ginsengibacter sp.]